MNKKIIAILLVFTLVITCFAACKKHNYETTKVGNLELLLYTDANGNTVINEDNQIIAVVTDSEGEILTYENGEEQTHYVQISGSYIGDSYIQGAKYKLVIPEGWRGNENNQIVKKNTDDNCYIKFIEVKTFEEDENVDEYFETFDANNEKVAELVKNEGYIVNNVKKNITIGKYEALHYKSSIADGDGNVIDYGERVYIVNKGTLYSLEYCCRNAEGYDEAFNFETFIQENFTFKG